MTSVDRVLAPWTEGWGATFVWVPGEADAKGLSMLEVLLGEMPGWGEDAEGAGNPERALRTFWSHSSEGGGEVV